MIIAPLFLTDQGRTCRLTGFAAFTGLGTYAIWEARRQGTFANKRPPGVARMAGKAQAVIGFGAFRFHYTARRGAMSIMRFDQPIRGARLRD